VTGQAGDRLRELFERGRHGPVGAGSSGPAAKYNGLADPPGVEELATALAERIRPLGPTAVVVWEDPEDVVIGHVVGRELGVPVIRAYDADGLVGHGPGLPAAPRVVLVSDAVRDPRVVRASRALADHEGGALVATAVLEDTPELGALGDEAGTRIALLDAADEGSG
jgi:adenine/guanine phosphoribosyltransferase-like PRPP-binding protein